MIYEAVYQQLSLTADQEKKIEAHKTGHKSESDRIRKALILKKEELRDALKLALGSSKPALVEVHIEKAA